MFSKTIEKSGLDNFHNRLMIAITKFSKNPSNDLLNNILLFNHILLLIKEAKNVGYDLRLNDRKSKYTPIHFAVTKITLQNEKQMMRILQILLDNGADINKSSTDDGEFTPLHTAARRALPNTVAWLLEKGANKNVKDKKYGAPYKTALDYVNKSLNVGNNDPAKIVCITQIQSLFNEPSLSAQTDLREKSRNAFSTEANSQPKLVKVSQVGFYSKPLKQFGDAPYKEEDDCEICIIS